MDRIREGVKNFRERVFPEYRQLFEGLADGQSPAVMFITCADSRVDPSLITSSPPGSLFVLRNAGNLIPTRSHDIGGEIATVDYALRTLRVRHVVICGHSDCGAMTHLMQAKGSSAPVDRWLAHAQRVRMSTRKQHPAARGAELVNAAANFNVLQQLDNLRTWPFVMKAVRSGDLTLHGWMYDIATGTILAYEAASGGFGPLADVDDERELLDDLGTWTAVLHSAGATPDAVADAIIKVTSWPRREVMQLFGDVPLTLLEGLNHIEAEVVETWLTDAGASLRLQRE